MNFAHRKIQTRFTYERGKAWKRLEYDMIATPHSPWPTTISLAKQPPPATAIGKPPFPVAPMWTLLRADSPLSGIFLYA